MPTALIHMVSTKGDAHNTNTHGLNKGGCPHCTLAAASINISIHKAGGMPSRSERASRAAPNNEFEAIRHCMHVYALVLYESHPALIQQKICQ